MIYRSSIIDYSRFRDLLKTSLQPYGVQLSPSLTEAIGKYIEILVLWNRRISLTSLTDIRDILERHFGESLFAIREVENFRGRLADVGTGAGFPGLALRLACPHLEVTLIESVGKKCAFLAEVKRNLKLESVQILHGRLESYAPGKDVFDFVTCRAFGNLQKVLVWARGVLKESGKVVLWTVDKDASNTRSSVGWIWKEPISIPGSRRRKLLIGLREP